METSYLKCSYFIYSDDFSRVSKTKPSYERKALNFSTCGLVKNLSLYICMTKLNPATRLSNELSNED